MSRVTLGPKYHRIRTLYEPPHQTPLHIYEHLIEPMADLLGALVKEFNYAQLGDVVSKGSFEAAEFC